MLLYVQRESGESKATMGKLYIDGEYFCHTMEPRLVTPGAKIWGQTAIGAGQYLIILHHSPRFNRELPLILNIPDFTSILIHPLNRVNETQGCIGIGFKRGDDENGPVIWESQKATESLMARLLEAEKRELLAICIKDA